MSCNVQKYAMYDFMTLCDYCTIALNPREVQPQVAEVVVLAEEDLAVAARHRVAEDVAVAAALQDRDRHAEVADLAGRRVVAEHLGHLRAAEAEDTAVVRHGHRADRRQQRPAQRRAEPALFIQREQRCHRRRRCRAIRCGDLSPR